MEFEYELEQKVPFLKSFLFGVQWAALTMASIIILGRVIGGLHFADSLSQVIYLQKILFVTALALFTQVFLGHRLPLIPGPSAVLLVGIIASQSFGLAQIYSSIMVGGLFITFLAVTGLFNRMKRLFTTNVVAVVLLLITFGITPTIRNLMIDSQSNISPFYNLSFSLAFVIIMFLCYRWLKGIWRSTLAIWALIAGSLIYYLIFPPGQADDLFSEAPIFRHFFQQMNFQWSIEPGVLISFIFCFIALSINDLGSIQSVNEMINAGDTERRITRGISISGLANMVSGIFGVIGPVNYSISPGIIASTRCASRFPLFPASAVLFIFAFSPAAAGFMGSVPPVVIGAVLAYVMASQVAAGLNLAFRGAGEGGFPFESGLVIGLSVLLGTIIAFLPGAVTSTIPPFLRPILGNGFVVGVISALILEHIVFRKK